LTAIHKLEVNKVHKNQHNLQWCWIPQSWLCLSVKY